MRRGPRCSNASCCWGGALLLFIPGHIWDFAGIGLFIIVYCLQRYYCPAGFRQTA